MKYLTHDLSQLLLLMLPFDQLILLYILFFFIFSPPDLLVLADLHGASAVRSLALKFIVDNGKEIVAQAGWREKLKVTYLQQMALIHDAVT